MDCRRGIVFSSNALLFVVLLGALAQQGCQAVSLRKSANRTAAHIRKPSTSAPYVYASMVDQSVVNPPQVVAIVKNFISPTALPLIQFKVIFSKEVKGVDPGDFTISLKGNIVPPQVSVTGEGNTYILSLMTGRGDGVLKVDLIDDDSIIDPYGNILGGPGKGNGDFLTDYDVVIDKTPPELVSFVRNDPSPINAYLVHYKLTFSESVVGVDTGDFALSTSEGMKRARIDSVSGKSDTYTVAIRTQTGSGNLSLTLVKDCSITDIAYNALVHPPNGYDPAESYTIDKSIHVPGDLKKLWTELIKKRREFNSVTLLVEQPALSELARESCASIQDGTVDVLQLKHHIEKNKLHAALKCPRIEEVQLLKGAGVPYQVVQEWSDKLKNTLFNNAGLASIKGDHYCIILLHITNSCNKETIN